MEATIARTESVAPPSVPATHPSSSRVLAGRIVTALPVLFLAFDTVIKLVKIEPVVESFKELGYPVSLARGIGLLELVCLVFYLVPRTAPIGAVLLTGYLGGAIATHVRIESPLLSHTLFPIYVGALLWLGLYLRDRRVRAFLG
jgi:hypothetical protein